MSVKVKVFQTSPLNASGRVDKELEEQINGWLADNPTVRITSVETTALVPLPHEGHSSGSVICMVFFTGIDSETKPKAGFLRE